MLIKDVMSRNIQLIDPDTTMRDAARRMREADVGALPVGENDRLVGMITDRDIALRGVADDLPAGGTAIRSLMSEGVFWCFEDEDLSKAADLMAQHQIKRLPIVNRDKRLVGMISLGDLARNDRSAADRAEEGIAKPTGHARA